MRNFTLEDATKLVTQMLDRLYEKDSFLLQKKLNITERAITHRMGMYLQEIVPKNIDVDCEYNRMGKNIFGDIDYTDGDYFAKTVCLSEGGTPEEDEGSRVFPDIIVHERATANNYIIVEVKIDWKSGKAGHDIKKLKAYKTDLKYQHAFYLQLTENRKKVRVDVI
jgi:hypothetical protein